MINKRVSHFRFRRGGFIEFLLFLSPVPPPSSSLSSLTLQLHLSSARTPQEVFWANLQRSCRSKHCGCSLWAEEGSLLLRLKLSLKGVGRSLKSSESTWWLVLWFHFNCPSNENCSFSHYLRWEPISSVSISDKKANYLLALLWPWISRIYF